VYLDIINQATDYVHIMTPYLIIDNEMATALSFAARRGVDVKIILPGIPDKKSVYAIARTYYPQLLAAGVKIYEYTPGFVHAKEFVSDDCKAVVGTINLDFRSLSLHFENGCWFYNCKAVHDVKADFEHLFKVSEEVTGRYKGKRSLTLRLGECILRLLSPMM
jgi:cardiolipin synthase